MIFNIVSITSSRNKYVWEYFVLIKYPYSVLERLNDDEFIESETEDETEIETETAEESLTETE